MNDYFKPAYTRWFYSPRTFWGNIYSTFFWLKCCWQRAFRGWSDEDWWNMAQYLSTITLPMLKRFKEQTHGYPGWGRASTPEKWDTLLDEMIGAFEAAKRVTDDEYNLETWFEDSERDMETFRTKSKIFMKWFFYLWD